MSGQREHMDGRRGQLQEAGTAGPQVGSRVWDLLFLKNLRGLGKRFINEFYVPSFAETDDVRHWIRHAIPFEEADLDAAEEAADRICGWLEGHPEVQAVTVFDPLFPERLKELGADCPPLIYVRADRRDWLKEVGAQCCVAVIGSRWPGEWTWEQGPAVVGALCGGRDAEVDKAGSAEVEKAGSAEVEKAGSTEAEKAGSTEAEDAQAAAGRVLVLSGLARGCDGIGHRGAMTAGTCTAAVMASGIDIITPSMHEELAEEIIRAGGALLSEYDPGTEPEEFRYAERDRLVAALADGLLVLECGVRSGTMLTVKAGAKLDRMLGCILPEKMDASDAKAFEGNQYMAETLGASALPDLEAVEDWRDRLLTEFRENREKRRRTSAEMTVQMSFL